MTKPMPPAVPAYLLRQTPVPRYLVVDDGTGFIPVNKPGKPLPPPDGITPPGLVSTVRHALK